jgi:hypothetical protein
MIAPRGTVEPESGNSSAQKYPTISVSMNAYENYYNVGTSPRFDRAKNHTAVMASANAADNSYNSSGDDPLSSIHKLAHPRCLSILDDPIPELIPNDEPYWATAPPSPHIEDGSEQVIAVSALGDLQNASQPNTVRHPGVPTESDHCNANTGGQTSTVANIDWYECRTS